MKCQFTCASCACEFVTEWEFGDEVTCARCGTVYETDYETNSDDDIQGPWLGRVVYSPAIQSKRQP